MPGIIFHDGTKNHQLAVTNRDWDLLFGPFFLAGDMFLNAIGYYELFTVARGIPDGSSVTCRKHALLKATSMLIFSIHCEEDLLSHDYSYSFSVGKGKRRGRESIRIRGSAATLMAQPRGFCYIRVMKSVPGKPPRLAEFIDLRLVDSIETDTTGALKVHRKQAEMHWLELLPSLKKFLTDCKPQDVVVEYHNNLKEISA